MHYLLPFPKRAVQLIGCMRSGKSTMLLSHAAVMSKVSQSQHGRSTLIVTDPGRQDDARETFAGFGGDVDNLMLLSLDAQSSVCYPKLSQLSTVVFDIAAIQKADSAYSYTEPSARMLQFLKTMNEFTALQPYIAYGASAEGAVEHPITVRNRQQAECEAARTIPYFTLDRSRAELWDFDIVSNLMLFAAKCHESEAVFIRSVHWGAIIGHNTLCRVFDAAVDPSATLNGCPGQIHGCKIYTDAFVPPAAKDEAEPAIYFIPRT